MCVALVLIKHRYLQLLCFYPITWSGCVHRMFCASNYSINHIEVGAPPAKNAPSPGVVKTTEADYVLYRSVTTCMAQGLTSWLWNNYTGIKLCIRINVKSHQSIFINNLVALICLQAKLNASIKRSIGLCETESEVILSTCHVMTSVCGRRFFVHTPRGLICGTSGGVEQTARLGWLGRLVPTVFWASTRNE